LHGKTRLREEKNEMKGKVWSVLLAVALLATAASAFGDILLEDDFNDPNWSHDVWSDNAGSTAVVNGELVFTGANVSSWRNDFIDQDVEITADAARSDRPAGFLLRRGADGVVRAVFTPYLGNGGRIFFGEDFAQSNWNTVSPVDTPGLSGALHLWARISGLDAMFMITDGVRTYGTVRRILGPSTGPGEFGLVGGGDQRMDNFVVSTPVLGLATLTGKVTDSSTGLPIAGAVVELGGTSFSTTTAADGSYTLTDLPEGVWYNAITRKVGYLTKGALILVMPGTNTNDAALDPFSGIDWARAASASASSTSTAAGISPSNVNDGNAFTGWLPGTEATQGEWVQLAWDQSLEIAGVLIDSSGPTKDYNLEYSTNGESWTLIKNVTTTQSGHTHWLEIVDETSGMPSPVTLKYLRVYINSDIFTDVGTIYAIECYKSKGSVTGYVKDQSGAGLVGATVYMRSEPSRLQIKATTGAGGYYSIPVPSGNAISITAATSDSLAVSSKPLTVVSGSPTAVRDIVVRGLSAVQRFADNFNDIADNQNDPRWVESLNDWTVRSKKYTVVGAVPHFATVKDVDLAHCVIDVDIYPTTNAHSGMIARYKDKDNQVAAVRTYNGYLYLRERYLGKDTTLGASFRPPTDSGMVHARMVVVGYYAQASISDEWNTYWTPVVTLQNLAGSGDLGHGKVGLLCDVVQYSGTGSYTSFDDFVVHEGTAPPPLTPVRPSDAKDGVTGSISRVQGVVTAVFPDYKRFAVEAEDRSSGIIVGPVRPSNLQMDEEVFVEGVLQSDGTLAIGGDAARTGRTVEIEPLGVNNRDLLGDGLTNKDLLVSTWGQILDVPVTESTDGTARLHITDGTAAVGGPTATVPGVGWTTIFEDNFDNGKKPEWFDDTDQPTYVVDGKLTHNYMFEGEGGVKAIVSGINEGKVQVSVDGYSNREMGVIMRYKSSENYLVYIRDPKWADWPCGAGGGVYWALYGSPPGWPHPGAYGATRSPAFPEDQPVPLRLTANVEAADCFYSITDGTTTYTLGPQNLDREMGLGDFPIVGGVGLAGDIAPSQYFCGETILPALYDNFVVEIPAKPRSVAADSVQVIVPASVVPPDLQVGDFVKVVGIAGNGLAVEGIRAVTVRQSDDLRKE
jgi:hypothetical protein